MDPTRKTQVAGIDSLRFVAALWVVVAHGAGPPVHELLQDSNGTLARVISQAYGVVFSGPAAVMVFFVVSGFCIHLPFVRAQKIPLPEYFVRRYFRIGGPLVAMLLIIRLWPTPAVQTALDGLWSVYCEIAYYTLYPVLFLAIRAFGLRWLIGVATAIAMALIAFHWTHLYLWEFGPLTFLTAFPAWLLGCLLANNMARADQHEPKSPIWLWRVGAWLLSVFSMLGVFHSPVRIGYPATLLIFSFYCYFWLQQELRRWRLSAPNRRLESGGAWSYSMYLVHMIVITAFAEWQLPLPVLLNWVLKFVGVLVVSYLFYVVVERPCHSAARRWGRWLGRSSSAVMTSY